MCSIIIINIILRDLLHHRCGKVSFSPYSRHILTAKGGHASSSCHNFSYFAFRSNILLNIQANLEDVSSGLPLNDISIINVLSLLSFFAARLVSWLVCVSFRLDFSTSTIWLDTYHQSKYIFKCFGFFGELLLSRLINDVFVEHFFLFWLHFWGRFFALIFFQRLHFDNFKQLIQFPLSYNFPPFAQLS